MSVGRYADTGLFVARIGHLQAIDSNRLDAMAAVAAMFAAHIRFFKATDC